MAEAKTKPTAAKLNDHLAPRASPEQLADCRALMVLRHLKRFAERGTTVLESLLAKPAAGFAHRHAVTGGA